MSTRAARLTAAICVLIAITLFASGCSAPSPSTVSTSAHTASPPLTDDPVSDTPVGSAGVVHEPWTFFGIDGRHVTTPHFEIYTTIDDSRLTTRLPMFYEAALAHYTTAFGELPLPSCRLVSYLFGDRRQWQNQTRIMLPEQAATFEGLGRGGFTTGGTAVLYDIDRNGRTRDTRH